MATYVSNVPNPPTEINNLYRVYSKLGISDPTVLFPMLGNDSNGDCTFAGWGHFKTLINGLNGIKTIPTTEEILKAYYKFTHGQDSGCTELDIMKKGKRCGLLGEKIVYYVSIDPKNLKEVYQTIWLFGACYIGFNVQQNAIDDFNKRVPWTPGTLTGDGHCVITPCYTQDMFTNLTWGNTQEGTKEWWNECVDEAWLMILPEEKNQEYLASFGFDWDQLLADAKAIAVTNKKWWFFNIFK
jgi:hypothetical protein